MIILLNSYMMFFFLVTYIMYVDTWWLDPWFPSSCNQIHHERVYIIDASNIWIQRKLLLKKKKGKIVPTVHARFWTKKTLLTTSKCFHKQTLSKNALSRLNSVQQFEVSEISTPQKRSRNQKKLKRVGKNFWSNKLQRMKIMKQINRQTLFF